MRNKLPDLNNHLFEQLERLNDPELKGEDLAQEIKRAHSISEIAGKIIDSAKTTVLAARLLSNGGFKKEDLPLIFETKQIADKV
jgi:hypothetical protein